MVCILKGTFADKAKQIGIEIDYIYLQSTKEIEWYEKTLSLPGISWRNPFSNKLTAGYDDIDGHRRWSTCKATSLHFTRLPDSSLQTINLHREFCITYCWEPPPDIQEHKHCPLTNFSKKLTPGGIGHE